MADSTFFSSNVCSTCFFFTTWNMCSITSFSFCTCNQKWIKEKTPFASRELSWRRIACSICVERVRRDQSYQRLTSGSDKSHPNIFLPWINSFITETKVKLQFDSHLKSEKVYKSAVYTWLGGWRHLSSNFSLASSRYSLSASIRKANNNYVKWHLYS